MHDDQHYFSWYAKFNGIFPENVSYMKYLSATRENLFVNDVWKQMKEAIKTTIYTKKRRRISIASKFWFWDVGK